MQGIAEPKQEHNHESANKRLVECIGRSPDKTTSTRTRTSTEKLHTKADSNQQKSHNVKKLSALSGDLPTQRQPIENETRDIKAEYQDRK